MFCLEVYLGYYLWLLWETALKRDEIETFRFHDLRHSAASYLAMNAVTSSLMGASKPKMPDFGTGSIVARTRERTISVRQPIASHRVIYGQTRVGGIITFLHTTDNNERLHQLVTIAGHELNSIGQIYLDDIAVTITSNTVSDTKYEDLVDVYTGVGTTSGDSALQTAMQTNTSSKWTSDHTQTGRAKIYLSN